MKFLKNSYNSCKNPQFSKLSNMRLKSKKCKNSCNLNPKKLKNIKTNKLNWNYYVINM